MYPKKSKIGVVLLTLNKIDHKTQKFNFTRYHWEDKYISKFICFQQHCFKMYKAKFDNTIRTDLQICPYSSGFNISLSVYPPGESIQNTKYLNNNISKINLINVCHMI